MADLSQLSNDQLTQLYSITKQETGGASDKSTITSPKGATGSMQVEPATAGDPGFGVRPSDGSPEDTARMGRDYFLALSQHYKDPTTAAIAYNMGPGRTDKWLENGANPADLPTETLAYAHNFNQNTQQATQQQQPQAPQQQGGGDLSSLTDDQLKQMYKAPADDKNSLWNNIKGLGLQAANLAVAGIETPAILGAGAIGATGRALEGQPLAANLAKTVENVQKNYGQFSAEAGLNKAGIDTSGVQDTAGYQLPNEAMNYIGNTLPGQLAAAGTAGSPFSAAQTLSPSQQAVAKPALQLAELATPFLHRGGGIVAEGAGAPAEAAAKLAGDDAAAPSANQFTGPPRNAADFGPRRSIIVDSQGRAVFQGQEPTTEQLLADAAQRRAEAFMGPNAGPPAPARPSFPPNMGPNEGPQQMFPGNMGANEGPQIPNAQAFARGIMQPVEPNMGPQRPPITVDRQGVASTNLGNTQEQMALQGQQAGLEQAQRNAGLAQLQGQGELFPQGTEGQASPFNPNRLSEDYQQPFNPRNPTNLRQGQLDFTQAQTPDIFQVNREGEAGTPQQHEEVAPYRDATQRRMDDMSRQSPEQLDMFNPIDQRTFDQFGPNETPRSLNPDEFAETVQNLAAKDGTRFPLPEDMEGAYSRYLDTVRDDQGGLFDRATIAKKFVEAAADESKSRMVADHPIVKANQDRVNRLQASIDQAGGVAPPGMRDALAQAQRTLEKSQENIGKQMPKDPRLPYEKDGVVNMFTFGNLPEMFKSIGAVLKGLHGVVFKTLDRMIPASRNLDSFAKIAQQGIKNFVNREANRDWSQTVNEKPMDQLGKIPGMRNAVDSLNPHAQDDLSPEELKAQFNQATDLSDSKVGNFLRNNVLQGGLMLSDFSRHPLVKYTTDSVAKAFRSADKWARENLLNKQTGLGQMIKDMPLDHFTEIRTLMEANEGTREFTPSELKNRGFTDEQIKYYQRSLELQKEAFTKFNTGRQAAGLPPVTPRIAHIAGYFTGDFKQIVKDSEGRVVAVLGHNNRTALGVIAKRFQELHPDGENLDMGKPILRKGSVDDHTFNGFMNILNELSKTNADIDRIVQAYHDTQMASTNKLSQMANRGKFKSNPENTVGGAEGSKLWQSMQQNAIDGGKQQLKYLDSVNRWSEFQQAISKAENFIKDPTVDAPNAKAVSQDYLDNQMHRNLGDLNKFTNSMVNGIAEVTGVGPTQMRQMANFTKTGLLNMFVGLGKFSHSLVTLLQPIFGIPMVNSVMRADGAAFGKASVLSIFKSLMSNKDMLQSLATKQPISDPFVRAANEYARANDSFNTSQFNMGTIAHQPSKLGNALHINVTVPESGTRAFTYMYYAHMLKDTVGDQMSDKEIFGTAHNAVQKVMADYSREAAAPMFNKMGFLGDLTRMLTTFKMNQISQAATAGKMFGQGKVGPMVTMLATSIAASGVRGFIGYNIANGLLGQLTTWATKQGLMQQPTNLDQILLHSLHGVNKGLADALNFGMTSGLGIDMTGSLSHADDIPDDPLGTLLPEGSPVAKVVGSVATLAEHPNKQNAKAALYDALPNSMKGVMENMAYTDKNGNYYDPHTGNLVANRTPTDQMKRNFSFRPLDESKMRLQATVGAEQNQQLETVKSEIIKRALSDSDSGSLTQQAMHDYANRYYQAGGDPTELANKLATHMGVNKHLNIEQREAGMASGLAGAERYQRAQGLK
jgi:hypothetical protein